MLIIVMGVCKGEAREYEVFRALNGEEIRAGDNLVVRGKDDSGIAPDLVEFSTDCNFGKIIYTSSAWVKVEDWWQMPLPSKVFPSGQVYWRLTDDDQRDSRLFFTVPVSMSASGERLTDPEDYAVASITCNDGKMNYYTLINRWTRSQRLGNPLGRTFIKGRLKSSFFMWKDRLYSVDFDNEIDNTRESRKTFTHRFYTVNLSDGSDASDVNITIKNSTARNRRYEECGTDSEGTPWIASVFNGHTEWNQIDDPYRITFDELKSLGKLSIISLNMDGENGPEQNQLIYADYSGIIETYGNLPGASDYLRINNIRVIGSLATKNFSVYATVFWIIPKDVAPYRVGICEYRWDYTPDYSSSNPPKPVCVLSHKYAYTRNHSICIDPDGTSFWIKSADWSRISGNARPQPLYKCTATQYKEDNDILTMEEVSLGDDAIESGNALAVMQLDGETLVASSSSYNSEEGYARIALHHIPLSGSPTLLWDFGRQALDAPSYTQKSLSVSSILCLAPETGDEQTAYNTNFTAVDLSKSSVTSHSAKINLIVHTYPNTLAAYSITRHISTSVENISRDIPTTAKLNYNDETNSIEVMTSQISGNLCVFNLQGRIIFTQSVNTNSTCSIPLPPLPDGIYIATFSGAQYIRFVVK